MKNTGSKLSLICSVCMMISCSAVKEMQLPAQSVYMKNCSVDICMPKAFIVQQLSDMAGESISYVYSFQDCQSIILSQGALSEFEMDSFTPYYSKTHKDHLIKKGKDDSGYWRKDRYTNGLKVYYYGVSKKNRKNFDAMLDSVKVYY